MSVGRQGLGQLLGLCVEVPSDMFTSSCLHGDVAVYESSAPGIRWKWLFLKKGKEFLGPVITGRRLKKITQMFTTGKTCCAFKKWMEDFKDIKHSGLLKHKITVRTNILQISLHPVRKDPTCVNIHLCPDLMCRSSSTAGSRRVAPGYLQAQEILQSLDILTDRPSQKVADCLLHQFCAPLKAFSSLQYGTAFPPTSPS